MIISTQGSEYIRDHDKFTEENKRLKCFGGYTKVIQSGLTSQDLLLESVNTASYILGQNPSLLLWNWIWFQAPNDLGAPINNS